MVSSPIYLLDMVCNIWPHLLIMVINNKISHKIYFFTIKYTYIYDTRDNVFNTWLHKGGMTSLVLFFPLSPPQLETLPSQSQNDNLNDFFMYTNYFVVFVWYQTSDKRITLEQATFHPYSIVSAVLICWSSFWSVDLIFNLFL